MHEVVAVLSESSAGEAQRYIPFIRLQQCSKNGLHTDRVQTLDWHGNALSFRLTCQTDLRDEEIDEPRS